MRLLERILKRAHFTNVVGTTDSRQVAKIFAEFQPDLVLTDWLMPDVDGPAVIEQLGELIASDDYLPIVVLTADITPQTRQRALAIGANDFLTKPFDQTEVLLRIQNLLQARYWHVKIQEQNAALEESVRLRTIELERALAELKGTQKQVIQQERLAALGAMAGGIAHDFNNSLCAIIGFSEILLHQAQNGLTGAAATRPLTMILTAAEDASQIVDRLREFYRPNEGEKDRLPIQLNKLVEQAISLTSPRWKTQSIAAGREIFIEAELGQVPIISGNGAEVREVLTNLIFNAVDAMPDGGTITLRTFSEGDDIVLQISDTGTGMTEEVRARCLEPFFTTKGERGTGLGLSMVFGIVQRHSGTIQLESRLGLGTTFTFRFPAARRTDDTAASAPETINGSSLHVLVVDDQPVLRQLLCEYLSNDLHTSETAGNGEEALSKFRERKFDLVVTDQIMAHMDG
ncbi:MAG: response regulator, partial [Verrucomicrobiota bacterium]|nr:response regulator [Verrucomicrobiota bacterium]